MYRLPSASPSSPPPLPPNNNSPSSPPLLNHPQQPPRLQHSRRHNLLEATNPQTLRKSEKSRPRKQHVKKKDWNPATFFLCIFLCIGSMSIQMIALRKDFEAFTRQSDARIGLLREVVEKLQNGEEVNVEKVLGTGDPEREKEWDEGD
ncbi:hypothetical protein B0T21DRAFT_28480 [Apiosordaria backusii]|uniref:Uncharacterized protein n=1 Tax=Apiosordaria backusii TaxID=314023 RepID=A0AA40F0B0_9PEZI|nr:hypothetical protein B0T21DRAFT_28480 [Apiosordaria backusii]